jgi:hypothetical protein
MTEIFLTKRSTYYSPHIRAEYRGQNPRHMLLLQPPPLHEGEAASRAHRVHYARED